jgi:hypothetical protein
MVYFLCFIVVVIFVGMAIRSHKKDRMLKSTSPSALCFHLKEKVECSTSIGKVERYTGGSFRQLNWTSPSSTASLSSSASMSTSASPSQEYYEDCDPTGPSFSADGLSKDDLKELLINLIKKC